MKKISLILTIIFLLGSCKKSINSYDNNKGYLYTPISDSDMENAVIYEVNIRQYSESGTFEAFTNDIPHLKELGVKIIWVMPIFPISKTKRKATGGDFAYLIEDEDKRNRMLGSYYAVSDFTKVNPEFGTINDFRKMIKTAHENGMFLILDWVPNHTGWDHKWLTTNPEYYTQNEKGEVIDPINPDSGESWGWADVADLNYDNMNMRQEMIQDMLYWIEKEGIDGFRCDVASAVPVDFWKEAIPKLRSKKSLFMLAEADEPKLLKGKNLFDMAYGWERHHVFNQMAKSDNAVTLWDKVIKSDTSRYEDQDIIMNFVTNHDENSWNGTIRERMGDAAQLLTALSFISPGMPLIYSGQEYDLNHRLLFFEKDQIPHTKKIMWPILEKLGRLKNQNPALNGGKNPASYKKINFKNSSILSFEREKNGSIITFVGNFSSELQTIKNPSINAIDLFANNKESSENLNLKPWGFKILLKDKF